MMAIKRGGVWHGIIKCDSYQAWLDWRRAGGIFYDVCSLFACFSAVGGKVKDGFITSQISIVNQLLGPFINDLFQYPVSNDFDLNSFRQNIVTIIGTWNILWITGR